MLVDHQRNDRLQRIVGRLDLPQLLLAPHDAAAAVERQRVRLRGSDAPRAHAEFPCQHLGGSAARCLAVNALGARIELEAEAPQPSDEVVFDVDRAVGADLGVQFVFVSHALHQCAGASVNEALRQLLVQGVR